MTGGKAALCHVDLTWFLLDNNNTSVLRLCHPLMASWVFIYCTARRERDNPVHELFQHKPGAPEKVLLLHPYVACVHIRVQTILHNISKRQVGI